MTADTRLAASLASRAGELLVNLRASCGLTGRELGKSGDAHSNIFLLRELGQTRPGDAVLSEESLDSPERLSANRVWIIDPLDGTREYGIPGRDDWAVHVALWQRGAGITAAAVAEPSRNTVYDSGSSLAQRRAGPRLRFLVSDSRPAVFSQPVAETLGADLIPMGSAGAKTMAVLRGDADAYLHAGGQWEWDSAAPVGVARAAGLHASRVNGDELLYNQAHPYLPDLLICRPEIAAELLRVIRPHLDN